MYIYTLLLEKIKNKEIKTCVPYHSFPPIFNQHRSIRVQLLECCFLSMSVFTVNTSFQLVNQNSHLAPAGNITLLLSTTCLTTQNICCHRRTSPSNSQQQDVVPLFQIFWFGSGLWSICQLLSHNTLKNTPTAQNYINVVLFFSPQPQNLLSKWEKLLIDYQNSCCGLVVPDKTVYYIPF